MRPICVPCSRFFKPDKNGFEFLEMMPAGSDARPGNETPHRWEPYKLWQGDRWKCPRCLAVIVVGVGRQPIAEMHHENFEEQVELRGPLWKLNDC
jgi:hypothetical protein